MGDDARAELIATAAITDEIIARADRDRRGRPGRDRPVKLLSGRELAAEIRAGTAALAAELTEAGRPPRLAIVTATADEASAWYRALARDGGGQGGHRLRRRGSHPGPRGGSGGGACQHRSGAGRAERDRRPCTGSSCRRRCPTGRGWPSWRRPSTRPRTSTGRTRPRSAGIMTGLPGLRAGHGRGGDRAARPPSVALSGRRAVVVGRSAVVGKPLAHLLLDRDATVTICHSRTRDLAAVTRSG